MPQVVAPLLVKVAIGTIVSFGLSVITRALAPKPKAPNLREEGRKHVVRSSIEAHQIGYGTAMVSGPLIFAESAGPSNEFLHLVVPVAGHEIEAIDSVWLNDVEILNSQLDGSGNVTSERFKDHARIRKHLGGETQSADSALVSEVANWTADHRGRGTAYVYLRLKWNQDIFPTGIPNMRAVIRGRKVWDPRSDPGNPGVRSFSNNAALCQLDYLMSDFGFGVPLAEIHEPSWIAAANVCDEDVELAGSPTVTQKRYTCDGSFQVDQKPAAIMEDLLTASAGAMVYQQGTFRGYAGAPTAATGTLDESDLRGPIDVTPRPSRSESFNAIRGTFVDADDAKAPYSLTDFPPITNATFESQDGGERVFNEIELPFTTNKTRAQRLANLYLQRARQGITVRFPAKLTKLDIATWDVVTVSIARLGWANKEFRVLEWALAEDGGVDLTLQEEAAAVYDFDPADEIAVDPAPDTNLPNPFTMAPPLSLDLASGTNELLVMGDGTIVSRLRLDWVAPADTFIDSYEIEWRDTSRGESYQPILRAHAASTQAFLSPARDGDLYDVRVRAVNALGVRSTWTEAAGHLVVGKTAPPSDVTSFTIDGGTFTWIEVDDLDLAGYLLRFHQGINKSFGNSIALHSGIVTASPFTPEILPSGQVTFLIKAIDTSRNLSDGTAFIITDLGDALVANVVETIDFKALGWPGTIANGTVDGGGDLIADDTGDFMWDPAAGRDMWTFDSVLLYQGAFEKMTYVDSFTPSKAAAGSILTIPFTAQGDSISIEYRRWGPDAMWSSVSGEPMWNPAAGTSMWRVPAYQPWPGSVVAVNDRYDLRAIAGFGVPQGKISQLTPTIDVPDIVERLNDVTLAAGGTRLPLTETYTTTIENVSVTLQDDGGAAVGVKVVDKNKDLGPLIQGLDDLGAGTAASIDATVQGY